jgi:hypothetical protein
LRKTKINNIIIILISLWCAIEFIISPHPYYGKDNGVFPTISVGSFSFDLSAILIFIFIGFSLILLFFKILNKQKISLGAGYIKYLVLAFSTVLIASIGVGFFLREADFILMLRVQIVLLLSIIFMNLYNIKYIISSVIKIIYFTGILGMFILLLSTLGIPLWEVTIYPDLSSYMSNMWFGLYLTMFSYAVLLNKILIYKKASIFDYILVILILLMLIVNIHIKTMIFATFIVTFTTFLFFFKARIKRIKIGVMSLLLLLFPVLIYQGMTNDQKIGYISIFSERYLKAPAHDLEGLVENLLTAEYSGGSDISAGRFDIWKMYFIGVSDTPIISDNYGKKISIDTDSVQIKNIAAHNSIMHYTYYAGYIAGISLLLIILYFIRITFNYKNRLIYCNIAKKYNLKEYEFHGILVFIYAIIGSQLVGGPLSNMRLSWFWWLLIAFVLKVINEAKMQDKNV